MSVQSWMLLLFLLSAGSRLDAVDVNWLTRIVERIVTEYRIKGQFCLAANIPLNQDPNTLIDFLQNDRYKEHVEGTLSDGDVYSSTNVVVAKPSGPVHAELRVLEMLKPMTSNSNGKFLLIYSYLSPCQKCTHHKKFNIIKYINEIVCKYWRDSAFVFKKVFDEPNFGDPPTKDDLTQSLKELGRSGLHLSNIFRCYTPLNLEFQCHSCLSDKDVSNICIDNEAVPQQGGSRSSDSRSRSRDSRGRSSDSRSRSSDSRGRSTDSRSRSSDSRSSDNRSRSSDSRSRDSRGRSTDSRSRSSDSRSRDSRGRSSDSRSRSSDSRNSDGVRSKKRGRYSHPRDQREFWSLI